MKKILFISLLLIPFLGFSQTTKPIDGFLGIKFGSTKLAVSAAIKAKGGILDRTHSDAESLMFTNVKLGDRKSVAFRITFVNNKAFEAEYIFATNVEAKIPGYYRLLVNDINEIYGLGEVTTDYTPPYKANDDNELLGLSAGKIDYHTMWTDTTNSNSIVAYINTAMTVHLIYQDSALAEIYKSKQQTKNSADY